MTQALTANEIAILKSRFQAGLDGHKQKVILTSYAGGTSTLRNPYYVSATLMPNGKPALLMRALDTPYTADTEQVYLVRYLTESVIARPVILFPYNTPRLSITTYKGLLVAIAWDAALTRLRMRTSADNGVTWTAEATLGGLTFPAADVAWNGGNAVGVILRANKAQDTLRLFFLGSLGAAPGAATVGLGVAGVLTGAYTYKITFVRLGSETIGGTTSAVVNPAAQQIAVSAIPLGPAGTTARKVYRTAAGGADGTQKLVTTIADNVTTVYNDNIADASLGATVPAANGLNVLYRETTNADPTIGWGGEVGVGFRIPSVGRNTGGSTARNQADTRAFAIIETKTAGTYVIAAESDDGDWHANHAFFKGVLGGAWARVMNDGMGGGLGGGQGANGNLFLDRSGDVIGYILDDDGFFTEWYRSLDSGATWSTATDVAPGNPVIGMGAGDGLAVPLFATKEFIWGGRAGILGGTGNIGAQTADLLVIRLLSQPVRNIFSILGLGATGGNSATTVTTDVSDRVVSISLDKATQLDADNFNLELHNEDGALNLNSDPPPVPSPAVTAYRDAVNVDVPAGYWRLGDSSGSLAVDSTAGARHGRYTGGYALRYGPAVADSDYAAHFDGVLAKMTAPIPALGAINATLEAWVYVDAVPSKGAFVKAGDAAAANGYGFGIGATDFDTVGSNLLVIFEGVRWINTGVVLTAGVWRHIALVIDALGKPIVYVNGVQVFTDAGVSATAPTLNLYAGGYGTGVRHAAAVIDEVAAYTAIVSAARLLAHYNARGVPWTIPPPPALALYAKPNVIVAISQWHGVVANIVQTFHGIADSVRQHDSPRGVVISGRCAIKKLLVQEVRLVAGQDLKVAGYVRDTSNFVYLNKTLNEVLNHILDYGSIALTARALAPSSFVFKELRGNDAETLMDLARRACDVAGMEIWADELGTYRTRAMGLAFATSAWTFRSFEDITVLDPDTDDDTLKTRVRVLGKANIGAKYLAEQFHWPGPETPGTTNGPAAVAYDPTTKTVWVLTQNSNLYRLDPNANMAIVAGPFALALGYPDGLSVDPLDNHLWVSDGFDSTLGNNANRKYKKINRDTQALMLGPFTNPDGDHCAIWAWNNAGTIQLKMTTYTTAKIVTMSIAGAEVSRVNAPVALPTALTSDTGGGLYLSAWDAVDFYQVSFAGSITNTLAQPDKNGNAISAVEDSLVYDFGAVYEAFRDQNLIVKYAPTTPTGVETATYAEAVNIELEKALVGEVRLARFMDLAVTDKAQAMKTAQRQLDRLSVYAKHITLGVLGHPGLQKGDRITIAVPGASINGDWTVLSLRSDQNARDGSFLMVLVVIPYRPLSG